MFLGGYIRYAGGMSALALDVGTYSIKGVSGKTGTKQVIVDKFVEIGNPNNWVVPSTDQQAAQFADLLDSFISDNKLPRTDVRLALPESVVTTKVIAMPPLTDAELASAIGWQAEQHIPISVDELALEYEVLYRPKRQEKNGQMRVLLVGARKSLITQLTELLLDKGIELTIIDTQTLAVIRSLQFTAEDPATMVIHMGGNSTILATVTAGELRFVYNIASGGAALTRALTQSLNLKSDQAEQYKRTYGMDPTHFEGRLVSALQPGVNVLVQEVRKALQFHLNLAADAAIRRLLLSGGGAHLPGLVQFLAEQLNLEVLVADPWAVVKTTIEPPVGNQATFAVTMGLLLRD